MSLYSAIAPKFIPSREIIQSEIEDLLVELEADTDLNTSVVQYAERVIESYLLDFKEINCKMKKITFENKKINE